MYRYESRDPQILDGALFAYVEGTDPEALLLIQRRKRDSGEAAWEFALARSNNSDVIARRDDRIVWSVPAVAKPWLNATQPYMLVSLNTMKPTRDDDAGARD